MYEAKAKKELENEYNSITQEIKIRSRAEWVEKSEKSNKYLLSLEKSNKVKSTINSVIKRKRNKNKNKNDDNNNKNNGEVSENQVDFV